MIDNLLSQIAEIIGNNMWLAPLLALIAGLLTSFTPCSLSNIPLVVGYVGGIGEKDTKKAFAYSAVFSVGTAVTFVTLGIIPSNFYVIETLGFDGAIVWQATDGSLYQTIYDSEPIKIAQSLSEYFE